MTNFSKQIQIQFNKMCATGKLFRVKMSGSDVWALYLLAFLPGDDIQFRDPESSTHNCNLCKNFIRRYGNIVAIKEDGTLMSMFDVEAEGEFANVAKELSQAIRSSEIASVFFETFSELNSLNYEKCSMRNPVFRLGTYKNVKRYTQEEADKFGVVKTNQIVEFNHLHLDVPTAFINDSGDSIERIMGNYRDKYAVFKRAMEELSLDSLILVRDLINQGSLLDGPAHSEALLKFISYKITYDELNTTKALKENWFWFITYSMHERIAKFKNTLIGVLCSELCEGKELNAACQSWNKRVDPANFMKATAPITQKQIAEARKFVEENNYTESFDRRVATLSDIKVSEILHSNVGVDEIKTVSIFDSVKSTKTQHKRSQFDGIEEVTIEKFMKDILPTCTSVEAFFESRLAGNLVTMTTANKADSKPIFKWPNNYSWSYNGNLAGKSQIKEAVKNAGGKVDGVLRFSLIWNDIDGRDGSDLDAWCAQPDGQSIGYSAGFRKDRGNTFSSCKGQLDLDNTQPSGKLAIENIYFVEESALKKGTYRFWVNQFSARSSQGFKAEIEFNGEMYSYEYKQPVKGNIPVAEVTFNNGVFTIKHILPATEGMGVTQEIYGLETNNFQKVNLVCLSPNHWGEHAIGNKHFFFMLDDCKSPIEIRSFHNENLCSELLDHRKVMEVLGTTSMVPSTDKQLSGLGFNATVRDEVILKLAGSFKRTIKVKF